MLNYLFDTIFGKRGSRLSADELEITDSIRRLRTLSCRDGRVSIAPSEVLTPEYLKERLEARKYLTR
jgi:hypothetical protein